MEGTGGWSSSGAPADGVTDAAAEGRVVERPGLAARVVWWLVGPLLTVALLIASFLMVLEPGRTTPRPTTADGLALALTLVLAATLLGRRRWSLPATLVASVAVVGFGSRSYPMIVLLFAPALCAAAAAYRCPPRRALAAVAAGAIGVGTLRAVGEYRSSDVAQLVLGSVVIVAIAVVARFVRIAVRQLRRPATFDDLPATPWYRDVPPPVAGWPDSTPGWLVAAAVALLAVVVVAVTVGDLTTAPPLAQPGDRVIVDGDGWAGVTGAGATRDGSVYAVGAFGSPFEGDTGMQLRRYGPSDDLVWEQAISAPLWAMPGQATRLAVAPIGDDAESAQIAVAWIQPEADASDPAPPPTAGATIEVLDDTGTRRWTSGIGRADSVILLSAPVALPDGGFAIAGGINEPLDGQQPLGGESDAFVQSYRPDGSVRWTLPFGSDENEAALGLAVDDAGALYVAGGSYGDLEPGRTGAFVAKVDADGAIEWTRQFGVESRDVAVAVAVDDQGPIVVWGISQFGSPPERNTVSAFATDGSLRWSHQHEATDNGLDQVTVAGGRVFASGCVRRTFLGVPVREQVGVVVEIVDGRATSTRQFGGTGGPCIQALAPGPGATVLVGGEAGGDDSLNDPPFLLALDVG